MVTNCSPISFTARHGGCGADVNGINDRFDFSGVPPRVEDLGTVHLIAIGGAGMSAVARLLMARGVPVQGSDAKDSPLLRALAAGGRHGTGLRSLASAHRRASARLRRLHRESGRRQRR